jgi:flavin reductase (DIM6/NTAB) family NADH-FMN oxidoreductase RutF
MVDLPWGDERKKKFVTNVGLITSRSKDGKDNIMAAEWTHHISYSPGLIAVSIAPGKQSIDNISELNEFGVNLASVEHNVASSISGKNHGFEVDKIAVLKELGYKFSQAKKIKALMVDGSIMQAECKVINKVKFGSHIMFIGEIVELYPSPQDKEPLVYYDGHYWKLSEKIEKPDQDYMKRMLEVIEKNKIKRD